MFSTSKSIIQEWFGVRFRQGVQWFTPQRRRVFWQTITILSLFLITVGLVVTWKEFPSDDLQFSPYYIALAVVIYVITYGMHLLGWQATTTLTFGRLPFRENVEAIASSELVKYLPTVAWYIANRVHFYEKHQIQRSSVITASFLEQVFFLGSGAFILAIVWLNRINSWQTTIIFVASFIIVVIFARNKITGWWGHKISPYSKELKRNPLYVVEALFWYGSSWLLGGLFLWAIVHIFFPVPLTNYIEILNSWLIAGLAGTIISLSVGTIGVAREATLTFLLAQYVPLPVSAATAVSVKLILTIGQIGCALAILSFYTLMRRGLKLWN